MTEEEKIELGNLLVEMATAIKENIKGMEDISENLNNLSNKLKDIEKRLDNIEPDKSIAVLKKILEEQKKIPNVSPVTYTSNPYPQTWIK